MTWTRFDKQLPPEDTDVMVSNGPAMGTYHYKVDLYANAEHQDSMIPLWSLDGIRIVVKVSELTQWSTLLPTTPRRIRKLTLVQRFKNWLRFIWDPYK